MKYLINIALLIFQFLQMKQNPSTFENTTTIKKYASAEECSSFLVSELSRRFSAQSTSIPSLNFLFQQSESPNEVQLAFEDLCHLHIQEILAYVKKNEVYNKQSFLKNLQKYYFLWEERCISEEKRAPNTIKTLLSMEVRLGVALWYQLSTLKEIYHMRYRALNEKDTYLYINYNNALVEWYDNLNELKNYTNLSTPFSSFILSLQKVVDIILLENEIQKENSSSLEEILETEAIYLLSMTELMLSRKQWQEKKSLAQSRISLFEKRTNEYLSWKSKATLEKKKEYMEVFSKKTDTLQRLSNSDQFVLDQSATYSFHRNTALEFVLPTKDKELLKTKGELELVLVYNESMAMDAYLDNEDYLLKYQNRNKMKNRMSKLPETKGDQEILAVGNYSLSDKNLFLTRNRLIPFESILKQSGLENAYDYLHTRALENAFNYITDFEQMEQFPLQYANYVQEKVKNHTTEEQFSEENFSKKIKTIEAQLLMSFPTFTANEVTTILEKLGFTLIQGAGDHMKAKTMNLTHQKRPVVINNDHEFEKNHIQKMCAQLDLPIEYFIGTHKNSFSSHEIKYMRTKLGTAAGENFYIDK